jgi:hypothetical protein
MKRAQAKTINSMAYEHRLRSFAVAREWIAQYQAMRVR